MPVSGRNEALTYRKAQIRMEPRDGTLMAPIGLSEQEVLAEMKLKRKIYSAEYYQKHKTKASYYQFRYRQKINAERRKQVSMKRREKDLAFTSSMILEMTNMDKLARVVTDCLDPGSETVFAGLRQ